MQVPFSGLHNQGWGKQINRSPFLPAHGHIEIGIIIISACGVYLGYSYS